MNVWLTGSTGFLGTSLVKQLILQNVKFVAVLLDEKDVARLPSSEIEWVIVPPLSNSANYQNTLNDVDVVVHLAARVHVMRDEAADPLTEFRRVNVSGTLNLAKQAALAGVRRFVFVSSIKVNGESTLLGHPFSDGDALDPQDPYGISKYEAEQGLLELASETCMEVVIIRPPLVYGPGVKANFASMMSWLERGVPLPLGAVHNQRSFVALDNLVDLIVTCIDHPKAVNQTFLVSDGEDLSTTELLQRMGRALGKPARLIPVPVGVMQFAANLLGKGAVAQRLFGSLQVDSSKARDLLGWKPVVTVDEALQKTADAFNAVHKK
ncbi:UDP-glucose 4-epimerase family protein [Pelodictyon phaeoclathratiforme]|jgi:nucleoside-diphosphate-sugar epimerase|uniref:NAD-dependent epimerase/dehydratase n=1 Tax=Pelodictyon phaeoclathratiforme (strain DSM 5477 / BU-1) TaxID=324925 RepID=B4SDE1_PELPB|nr:SDR family oxidoreductase [Pelodictyon phaeoclathratiforme]ACF42880.1 NAD-dependent epimerase/dehydratase [Pelodictyon phaeoclathratiforme BU-1]